MTFSKKIREKLLLKARMENPMRSNHSIPFFIIFPGIKNPLKECSLRSISWHNRLLLYIDARTLNLQSNGRSSIITSFSMCYQCIDPLVFNHLWKDNIDQIIQDTILCFDGIVCIYFMWRVEWWSIGFIILSIRRFIAYLL